MKLLIADDSSEKIGNILNLLREIDGFDPRDAEYVLDIKSARAKLFDGFYDLLILDLNMPEELGDVPSIEAGANFVEEIIDTKIGPSSRKKVWTEVKTTTGDGKRYTRCLVVDIGKQSYIIDVTDDSPEHMLRPIDKSEISTDSQKGKYFKFLDRDWEDKYDGR